MALKKVCIVGAGPSGLVAAKTLLHDARSRNLFSVTVFEAQLRVGGLWPSGPDDSDGLVHPQMLANQSRHSMQFSGQAWKGVDLGLDAAAADDTSRGPQMPRAWHVGRYLERYCARYLEGETERFGLRLGTRVSRTEQVADGRWHVWVRPERAASDEDAGVFDYLIVASGYFTRPVIPSGLLPRPAGDDAVPVVHSSQYRDLETLLPRETQRKGTVLVVGAQLSGVEIAGTLATQLSSAVHAPKPSPLPGADQLRVHHLIQQPTWIFSLYSATDSSAAPSFLPADLNSHNLRKRQLPLTDTQGHISGPSARAVHDIFRVQVGSDQADVAPELAMQGDAVLDQPPFLAISDTYLEHVRSGLVTVSHGRLTGLNGATASVADGPSLDHIAAVVLATGFAAADSLAFLPDDVKTALAFDAADTHQTVALAFHGTAHPDVPRLAFVGFYRAPFWGVLEMQARVATALFASHAEASSFPGVWFPPTPKWPALAPALAADHSIDRTLALRSDPRASQFPMGDYLYLVETLAAALGYQRRTVPGEEALGIALVSPPHYTDADLPPEDEADVGRALQQAVDVVRDARTRGRFVARAVFRSLQGTWRLSRELVSARPSHPSGRFEGTAGFRLRAATGDGGGSGGGLEYLYVEDGTFTASTSGLEFRATRRYIWRYDDDADKLSVWFVRTDDDTRADYLFHELAFAAPEDGNNTASGWTATAGHLCIDDFYDVRYGFSFSGVQLRDWRLRYAVRGPNKDYTIDGTYSRPPL